MHCSELKMLQLFYFSCSGERFYLRALLSCPRFSCYMVSFHKKTGGDTAGVADPN